MFPASTAAEVSSILKVLTELPKCETLQGDPFKSAVLAAGLIDFL